MAKQLPFNYADVENWKIETPFYVYFEEQITQTIKNLYSAFSWCNGFKEYFAVKANPNPSILRLLNSYGAGCDCASISELEMSRRCNIVGENIMFTSNETKIDEYKKAYELGAIINLDDITQIEILDKALDNNFPSTICLRLNLGEFKTENNIMGKLTESKFGMTKDQMFEAYKILKQKGVKHFGLHSMPLSACLDNDYYKNLAHILFNIVLEVKQKLNIEIEFVDFAGGLGIPYKENETALDINYIGSSVEEEYNNIIKSNGLKLKIFTELGRYITGPSGYLVTKCIGTKNTYKKYIGVDATACNLMRPAIYGSYHHIIVLNKENEPSKEVVDVVGSLCENNDKFAQNRELPKINIGDYLVIMDAGAHGYSMGYNYNGKLKCAEYLMSKNKVLKLIRRKETLNDYFSTLDIDKDFYNK